MDMTPHPTLDNVFVTPDGTIYQQCRPYSASCNGYLNVYIRRRRGRGIVMRRATVICETFHGSRPSNNVVRHRNGKSADDRPDNLQWGTPADNSADMVKHGNSNRGEKNPCVKLTEANAFRLKVRLLDGESGTALAKEFGVSPQLCCDIKKGRAWAWLATSPT